MPQSERIELDTKAPPFDQIRNIQRLATNRSGHGSGGHARHQLYVGRDKRSNSNVLIKLASKPGTFYQANLTNEIASLTTINRELPDSRYFPFLRDHGHLRDGRVYLIASLFDEFPLATTIGPERMPSRMVTHLRTAMEIARALEQLHGLPIYHVDLNPMNILYRSEHDRPIIRIVDFESSYEVERYGDGRFYNPPTTPGFSAPEVADHPPGARADIYSLGAVLYTMLAGYGWTWEGDARACVAADCDLDPELAAIVARAVELDPGSRYGSVKEFSAALASYLERIWPGRSW